MKTLAIVGIGPRGLYALEQLILNLSKTNKQISITAFEQCDQPGSGQVWDTNQSLSNWTNITERALTAINGRPEIIYENITCQAFPSYSEWSNYSQNNYDPDTFPPRRDIGKYLSERYNSLEIDLLKTSYVRIKAQVNSIDLVDDTVVLSTKDNDYKFDDVLITIGHQPTKLSSQLKNWHQNIDDKKDMTLFDEPYPLIQFDQLRNPNDHVFGIRGFGLAMIDVMRELAVKYLGDFEIENSTTFASIFKPNESTTSTIVPFSLDGLPMAPKPLNQNIDDWFKPTQEELSYFKSEIKAKAKTDNQAHTLEFITKPISQIVSRIYSSLNTKARQHNLDSNHLETIVMIWLGKPEFKHDLIQDCDIDRYKLIQSYIDMATGLAPISLDYCIGQVWRHCQPTLYASFSHAQLDNDIIKKAIALDEMSKRYSYGPPVQSMQQILALVNAGVLTLEFINNPNIAVKDDGWHLSNKNGKSITISVMINSVLDAPKLLDVNSPIIKNLLNNKLVEPIHTELGINTAPNGYVEISNKDVAFPVAVLGRLSKGSVIGVDAILECFGPRIEHWAEYYVDTL